MPTIAIRQSQRARHVRLLVKPAGLELVVPPRTDESQALRFLQQHRQWAVSKWRELQARSLERAVLRTPLVSGSTVPFQGVEVPLVIQLQPCQRIRIARSADGGFDIALPHMEPDRMQQQVQAALYAWVKRWLQGEALRLADIQGSPRGLIPRELRIKRMKTRWGSCGPYNDINLNWLLAFAPPTVLEYVVVHELCHIQHRNHSRAFWALVGSILPNWERERLWLKQHGAQLMVRLG